MNAHENMSLEKEALKWREAYDAPGPWCMALHGNHDEHQCHLKPRHIMDDPDGPHTHECYCGVWW